MRKWVSLGLVAAVSLVFAGASFADVPSQLTSTVACTCTADPLGGASSQTAAGKCTITPSGRNPSEDLKVNVVVRNVLGAPLAGSTTIATATNVGPAVFAWDPGAPPVGDTAENPQTGLSDAAGAVNFVFDEGGVNQTATPTLPNLDFAVTANGPGPGGPVSLVACSPQFQVVSFDLNGSGQVNLVDFALFASDLGSGGVRSDFNWSGAVNLVDFAQFAAHLGEDFVNQ